MKRPISCASMPRAPCAATLQCSRGDKHHRCAGFRDHWLECLGTLSGAGRRNWNWDPVRKTLSGSVASASATGQGMLEWTMTITDAGNGPETVRKSAHTGARSPLYQRCLAHASARWRVVKIHCLKWTPFCTRTSNCPAICFTIRPGLKPLLRYPYGCVEQTVSRAMPLYFLRNYARSEACFPAIRRRCAWPKMRNGISNRPSTAAQHADCGRRHRVLAGRLSVLPLWLGLCAAFSRLVRRDHARGI